jgi:hypothetical protein
LRDVFETIIRDGEAYLELLGKMKKFVLGHQEKKAKTTPAVIRESRCVAEIPA